MIKYIVMIKNGTIRSANNEQEQQLFIKLSNDNDFENIVKNFGQDTYVSKQNKETSNFINFTTNIMDAQEFVSKAEAKAFADYLQEVKKTLPTNNLAEIKAAKIYINIKEYK